MLQEKIVVMVEQLANPPPIGMSLCLNNLLPPVEIQTLEMFRSEDEQLVGHELVEALRKFKLSKVPPLSPSSRHESFLNFKTTIVHLKGNSYRQRNVKSNYRKLGFKVVQDLLTKK
jgi:hypothetical protein